jgi:hypothetical protein
MCQLAELTAAEHQRQEHVDDMHACMLAKTADPQRITKQQYNRMKSTK